ncbi:MAG: nitroreductase family protein [Acidimicrobiales bacterium]
MEFQDVVRRRAMTRDFQDRPLPGGALDRILANALRAPSAGFTQGAAFVVLEGRTETERFWSHTLAEEDRSAFPWPGLLRAPAVVIPLAGRQAYLDRYAEADKARTGLATEAGWPVPYWDVDCGFAAMAMLLTAVDLGLGALFFGIFKGQAALLEALGVPDGHRPIGAVALGHPSPTDRPSSSTARRRRPMEEVVHRGRW